ncbi:MAG: phenylalanine--tRNA ligase subunit beta [Opitutales bacterium]|nr:phenylalanine--tRNA ligase subunit beta [Opitutales bacterium]
MKLSLSWLNKYVDLSSKSVDEIAKALVQIGFEVEGVETHGLAKFEHVVVGEVLQRDQHPNADRLGVCRVDVGDGTIRQIVCGASNYVVGDRVPVALVGAVLPGGFEIKKSALRGVDSEGMMCSARELGMGEDHSGLLILTERPELGTPINDVFPGADTVYDIEVTPNRPDCLSYVGMARELAAYFDLSMNYPDIVTEMELEKAPSLVGELRVDVPDTCPHYRGYSIRGVKIAPSPDWLASALKSVGLRPINNVVDVTNYVLMELGQPLHAFDAAKIRGGKIVVRNAEAGEKITTLDGKERALDASMMVIADAERPLVVAGVMGSVDAEVDDSTVDIFLESAYFVPVSVRFTARKLGLSTDSSYRFERGVDPQGQEFAAMRAIDLILEVAGGELAGTPQIAGEPVCLNRQIEFTGDYMRKMLGFDVSDESIEAVLSRLELEVGHFALDEMRSAFRVDVPSFRVDLERPIDLVEEFLRIYGTDKIPSAPVLSNALVGGDDPMAVFSRGAANSLSARGFAECVNYPLRAANDAGLWSATDAEKFALHNPLSAEQSHLRPSVLPGLLDNLLLNQSRGNDFAGLYELGRVFRADKGKLWEFFSVGLLIPAERAHAWRKAEAPDFYTASAIALDLLRIGGVKAEAANLRPLKAPGLWQDGHCAEFANPAFSMRCGLLDLAMTRDLGIKGDVYAVEISFLPATLEKNLSGGVNFKYKALSQQPAATRDIALLVPSAESAAKVGSSLTKAAREATKGAEFELESLRVFDLYEGKGLPEGMKSLAYTLTFRSPLRTLTDAEVNAAFEKTQELVAKAGYSVRA